MKRCTLCGGKLNSEKRCTFCGLDNTKNDSMYAKMISRNSCEHEPLTHVHNEPAPERVQERKKTAKPNANLGAPQYGGNTVPKKKKTSPGTMPKNAKKAVGCSTVISLIPIIIALIGILGNIFGNVFDGFSEAVPDYSYEEEESQDYNPYEWVVDEMPETGDEYTTYLEAGLYEIGYHIPMGLYQIDLESEYGTIEVRDEFNGIYLSEFLDRDAERATMEDVQLYNGAYLLVYTGTQITLKTDNAQILAISSMPYEQTEVVKLEDELIVGEDLLPGAYDIMYKPMENEDSFVDIEIVAEDVDYGFHVTFGSEMGEEVFCNLPLPEGAIITVDASELENVEYLELVPSIATSENDLNNFYYAY